MEHAHFLVDLLSMLVLTIRHAHFPITLLPLLSFSPLLYPFFIKIFPVRGNLSAHDIDRIINQINELEPTDDVDDENDESERMGPPKSAHSQNLAPLAPARVPDHNRAQEVVRDREVTQILARARRRARDRDRMKSVKDGRALPALVLVLARLLARLLARDRARNLLRKMHRMNLFKI